jgi:hypothetical protein
MTYGTTVADDRAASRASWSTRHVVADALGLALALIAAASRGFAGSLLGALALPSDRPCPTSAPFPVPCAC